MDKINLKFKLTGIVLTIQFVSIELFAQMPPVRVPQQAQPEEDFTMYYIVLMLLFVGLLGAIGWLVKNKKQEKADKNKDKSNENNWDPNSVDADKELEWFRKHSKTVGGKTNSNTKVRKRMPKGLPQTSNVLKKSESRDFNETKKKVEKMQFMKLPIHSFLELRPAKSFNKLPVSNDPSLLNAIEQTQDEYEEDEQVRELAVRILAAFRTSNSVEALSGVALYDLSAGLRSKAVSILADYDHESVFETLLLACADPTREVRAAAARALFSLSFDRADAWTRITETGDNFRMIQAARAAIEGDLVERSIDRLVHEDLKYSYEAFTLVAMLIKSGETKVIFDAIENHRNNYVKMALLHVFKVIKDERTLPGLYAYIERNSLPEDLSNAANEVIKSFDLVAA